MAGGKARAGVLAGVVMMALAIPSAAFGAVTIGSNLAGTPDENYECSPPCTAANRVLPATSTASGGIIAPSDGVVVRWRIKAGADVTPVALRVTRRGDSDSRTGAGTGPTVTPEANRVSTYDVRIPIEARDGVAIDCCGGIGIEAFTETPGASLGLWQPLLGDAVPPTTPLIVYANFELLINADVEPDADGDGYGDETQDQCPNDPSHTDCLPPDTEITKLPSNKTEKPRAKYKFTSSEPGSTFECKLKGKGLKKSVKKYKDCDSPRKYKRLDEGKFKFSVRAIDAAGNVDPTPAKDKFKVVD